MSNEAKPQPKKGTPAWLKIGVFLVITAVLSTVGVVGKFLYESRKAERIAAETTRRLADRIVDPKVSAAALEKEGYYKVKFGGNFLQACRGKVLGDSFNRSLDNQAKAEKISYCIKGEIRKVEAQAQAQISIRARFGS